ncbi:hypothetical protein C8R43DRAFT_963590 [Mycena crocata]|nr:hypothetical protein C8R43DRAFT_963590 [Mycena crocata]
MPADRTTATKGGNNPGGGNQHKSKPILIAITVFGFVPEKFSSAITIISPSTTMVHRAISDDLKAELLQWIQVYVDDGVRQADMPKSFLDDRGISIGLRSIEQIISSHNIKTSRHSGLTDVEKAAAILAVTEEDPLARWGGRKIKEKLSLQSIHIPRKFIDNLCAVLNRDASDLSVRSTSGLCRPDRHLGPLGSSGAPVHKQLGVWMLGILAAGPEYHDRVDVTARRDRVVKWKKLKESAPSLSFFVKPKVEVASRAKHGSKFKKEQFCMRLSADHVQNILPTTG